MGVFPASRGHCIQLSYSFLEEYWKMELELPKMPYAYHYWWPYDFDNNTIPTTTPTQDAEDQFNSLFCDMQQVRDCS